MPETFIFYEDEDYPYRIEYDSNGRAINGASLRSNGSWRPINYGWEIILQKGTIIAEEKAYSLNGIKKKENKIIPKKG